MPGCRARRSVVPSGDSCERSVPSSCRPLSLLQVTLTAPLPVPWHCKVRLHHSRVLASSWLWVLGFGTDSAPNRRMGQHGMALLRHITLSCIKGQSTASPQVFRGDVRRDPNMGGLEGRAWNVKGWDLT